MSMFGQAGVPLSIVKDLSPVLPELELFARIERLVGEEAALLAIPRQERKPEQRDRLPEISAELDRIWEELQERATHLRARHDTPNPSGEWRALGRHAGR